MEFLNLYTFSVQIVECHFAWVVRIQQNVVHTILYTVQMYIHIGYDDDDDVIIHKHIPLIVVQEILPQIIIT